LHIITARDKRNTSSDQWLQEKNEIKTNYFSKRKKPEQGGRGMKKILVTTLSLGIFAWAGSAMAGPMTWTDVINFDPDVYIGWYDSFDYTHDITDDGFNPILMGGGDLVWDYNLSISLYDDNRGWDEFVLWEIAHVDQPGVIGDDFYDFSLTNDEFGWSILGLVSLNLNGTLGVTIESWAGDFYFGDSTLTANGYSHPVPEPATMFLFGAGLAGLAAVGRRRKTE
jgi:hypothetical protein